MGPDITLKDTDTGSAADESPSPHTEGIHHLPGYEAVQDRLRSAPSDEELTKETIFDLLRNQRRRYVLHYLDKHTEMIRLGELAEALARWEHEDDTEEVYITHRDRKRAYVSLYQTHLPKLDDAGVITYNQPRGTIELGPTYRDIRAYLDYSDTPPVVWHRLYTGSAVLGLSLLGLIQVIPGVVSILPEVVWYVGVMVILGSVVIAHTIAARSANERALKSV